MEKRNSNRHTTDQSIICTFLTSHSFNHEFKGKMKNYSDSGLYAEMPTQFKDGTVLLVRTKINQTERVAEKVEDGFRSISLVEVKWCRPLSADGLSCYATGLKHLAFQ
jgi:hypothetical protein